jgi:putative hemolysin
MILFLVFVVTGTLLFFALVETAFGLLMRLPQRLEAERESGGHSLTAYLDDPLRLFVPSRLLRGSLHVLLVVLLAESIGTGFPDALVVIAVGIAISVTAGQLLPALVVRRSPERILELLLPAFTAVASVVGPATALIIGWMGSGVSRASDGAPPSDDRTSSAPAANPGREAADQNRLLRSVVDFGDTLVREVMTPRPDIVAIRSDATIDDLRQLVREQEYSRLPVYTDNLDNITGLIVVKDLIQMVGEPDGSRKVAEMMRSAAFVPETKRVVELLQEFRRGRFQLAMVVDEYGGTAGLVTVEDVVEELVGEIRDEYDSEGETIVPESADTFAVSGKAAIGDLADRVGVPIAPGDFETVGGFILARVGRVPSVGERFDIEGLDVEILEAERRRIHKVRVHRRPAEAAEAAG